MSNRALGPGAKCCGEPTACGVTCVEQPASEPAPVVALDEPDLFDEEEDDE